MIAITPSGESRNILIDTPWLKFVGIVTASGVQASEIEIRQPEPPSPALAGTDQFKPVCLACADQRGCPNVTCPTCSDGVYVNITGPCPHGHWAIDQ